MLQRLAVVGMILCSCRVANCQEKSELAQAAVRRGLAVLERSARAYPSNQLCFSCHHQTLPLLSMTTARDAGLTVDEDLFKAQRLLTRNSFEKQQTRLAKGEHVGGRSATVSYGLWAFKIADGKPDELSEAMTSYLLNSQLADGSWKPPSSRPPLETSSVSCTVLSAIGVKRFASSSQQEEAAAAVKQAYDWLQNAVLEDQEDLNFALWGEQLLGTNEVRLGDLRNRVIARRHADGGWSQTADLTSDAYATGQTLYILVETGFSCQEAVFREGAAFLVETQHEDGSWHVVTRSKPIQPWFDNGDPHEKDQFISIAATSWATTALARSLR
jgi:N-acyl-D-amino-acid deacylase